MSKTIPMLLDEFIATMHWYRLALITVILDQVTKLVMSKELEYGQPVEILPVFNLMLAHNQGAAFSFLHDAGGWQRWLFSGLAIVVSAVLLVWIRRARTQRQLLLSAALSLVLGGAIGNLADRLRFGYVVDFLSLHWGVHYFPAFNLADTAITIGAGLMLIDMLINPEHHRTGKKVVEGQTK